MLGSLFTFEVDVANNVTPQDRFRGIPEKGRVVNMNNIVVQVVGPLCFEEGFEILRL